MYQLPEVPLFILQHVFGNSKGIIKQIIITSTKTKWLLLLFTVAVLIQLIFIRSENPRNEHVTCVGRYADVIRLVCEHIFLLEALFKSLPCFQCS